MELDTTLSVRDLGVSAFRGKNRQAGLGKFLAAVEQGKVKPGSFLLLESLDRLSRQQISEALELMLSIVRAGIHIVTLMDGQEYNPQNINDLGQLIISLTIMSRAHEESATKSKRVASAWKRKRAVAGEQAITAKGPNWLKLNGPLKSAHRKWEQIPEKVATIKRIARMYLDGMGGTQICKILNDDKVPTLNNRTKVWNTAAPIKIMRSRSLVGEFQPKCNHVAEGDVIQNYYPRVLSRSDFNKINDLIDKNGAASKRKAGGRGGTSNLFTRVVRCERCGAAMHYTIGRRNSYLSCSAARKGMACTHVSWNYRDFENRFLGRIVDTLTIDQKPDGRVGVIENNISELDNTASVYGKMIRGWQDAIGEATNKNVMVGLMKRIEQAETEIDQRKEQRQAFLRELQSIKGQDNGQNLDDLKKMIKDKGNVDVRRKIMALIQLLIGSINIDTAAKIAQIRFKNGYVTTICGEGVRWAEMRGKFKGTLTHRGDWDGEGMDIIQWIDPDNFPHTSFWPTGEPLPEELIEHPATLSKETITTPSAQKKTRALRRPPVKSRPSR